MSHRHPYSRAQDDIIDFYLEALDRLLEEDWTPLGLEELSTQEQLAIYEALTPQDIARMVADAGPLPTGRYILDMERRRAQNA